MKIYWHQGAISLSINSISNAHLSIHELLRRWILWIFFIRVKRSKWKSRALQTHLAQAEKVFVTKKKLQLNVSFCSSDSVFFKMLTFMWNVDSVEKVQLRVRMTTRTLERHLFVPPVYSTRVSQLTVTLQVQLSSLHVRLARCASIWKC